MEAKSMIAAKILEIATYSPTYIYIYIYLVANCLVFAVTLTAL